MEFTDYLMYIVVWIAGAVYGWYARERHAERKLDRFFNRVTTAIEEIEETTIPITIERLKGCFYVYNKETNEFMGQAETRKQLEEVLSKRYPNKKFMASTQDLKVLNDSL